MRRRMRPRPLLLVILAHVLVVGLVPLVARHFSQEGGTEGALVYVLPITPVPPPAVTPEPLPSPGPRPTRSPAAPSTVQSPQGITLEPEPITPTAPAPRIDWQREME